MKTKITFSISLILSISCLVLMRGVGSAPSQPIITGKHLKSEKTALSQSNQSTKITASRNQSNKHSSDILRQHLAYPEIQYYLLGTVTDPQYSNTWSHNTIQANRAWDLTTGSSDSTVAVIDTGFALNHQELANAWHLNSGEQGMTQSGDTCWTGSPTNKQSNNCDDDQNGYTDDWRGYDFYYNDNDVSAGQVNSEGDGTQHGTMVAGVIAAQANNGYGSAGIDQQAKIMPLQVFSDDSDAFTSDLVAAVEYAVDNGADVINLSLGSNGYDSVLLQAIQYATNNGVLVVAASGNCALNDKVFCNSLAAPGRMTYPALYEETLSVGATTNTDARASYSSYSDKLDMVAPGSGITPLPIYTVGNQVSAYATASGTSFAAPLVAGVASLLLAQNSNLSPDEIAYTLTESVDKVSGMSSNTYTNEYGFGRLNAHKATLLALASTQASVLGDRSLSPREPAIGSIWRATSGTIQSDESILVGCRVFESDVCSVTTEGANTLRFNESRNHKGDPLRYIFIKGSDLPSGNWLLSIHNNEHATELQTVTR